MKNENVKNVIVWLMVLVMMVVSLTVLLTSLPNFIGVEQVHYPEITETTTDEKTVTQATGATTSLKQQITTTAAGNITTVKTDVAVVFPLNINTATAAELMQIPGIGEVYATRIIEHREKIGGFVSLDQLLEVKGVGEKRLQKWSPYLTL